MKNFFLKVKEFFQISELPPQGEYPEEDRKREFCVKAKNCCSYGTKKCPLFS